MRGEIRQEKFEYRACYFYLGLRKMGWQERPVFIFLFFFFATTAWTAAVSGGGGDERVLVGAFGVGGAVCLDVGHPRFSGVVSTVTSHVSIDETPTSTLDTGPRNPLSVLGYRSGLARGFYLRRVDRILAKNAEHSQDMGLLGGK